MATQNETDKAEIPYDCFVTDFNKLISNFSFGLLFSNCEKYASSSGDWVRLIRISQLYIPVELTERAEYVL